MTAVERLRHSRLLLASVESLQIPPSARAVGVCGMRHSLVVAVY